MEVIMLKKVFLVLMLLPVLSFADTPRGEKLVERLWKDIKEANIEQIKEYTSQEFQATDFNTTYNRYEELEYIKALEVQGYELSDIKATQGEKVIVVTYSLQAIVGMGMLQRTITGPLISMWKKQDDHWKWVAHADLTLSNLSGQDMPN
jgi:hypothetical protein